MAFYKDDAQEDVSECPVCYESLCGTERTLSCGHVFCHDCLVKTLVSVHTSGNIRDTIVCPICRHLTFIRKQKDELLTLTERKGDPEDGGGGQTLEVPMMTLQPPLVQFQETPASPTGVRWIRNCFHGVSERFRRQRLIRPCHSASQIFIISAQGRPMTEEDAFSMVMTVVHPHRRRRYRVCTTARCLLVLLSTFTMLALVAAILPWILLA
ncbi:RING finger protein 222 [Dunckerocampus dactyliophorus]|uniref:RING finger protein 222 n=1 Tax=Dunckerocampus dactyliophorus TaxID=161453 RepID=UPI002404FC94|nr:RING finger protein 222 [Dunckerocampus dactyliophorus]